MTWCAEADYGSVVFKHDCSGKQDLSNTTLQFQLLTDQADQRVYEREGRDAVLECPTNAYTGFVKCTFTDPYGNDFLMVGR